MATTAPVTLTVEIISTKTDPANHNISTTLPEPYQLNTATNTYTTDTTAFSTTVYTEFAAQAGSVNEDNIEVRYKVRVTDVNAPVQTGVTADPVASDQGYLTNPTSAADLQAKINTVIANVITRAAYN